jgi:hypothetical protein
MRIIFARAIDSYRTALVLDLLGGYRVGVVYIERAEEHIGRHGIPGQDRIFGYSERDELRLWLVWEWYEVVTSPEQFMDTRGWERPPPQRRIEGPRTAIGKADDDA